MKRNDKKEVPGIFGISRYLPTRVPVVADGVPVVADAGPGSRWKESRNFAEILDLFQIDR